MRGTTYGQIRRELEPRADELCAILNGIYSHGLTDAHKRAIVSHNRQMQSFTFTDKGVTLTIGVSNTELLTSGQDGDNYECTRGARYFIVNRSFWRERSDGNDELERGQYCCRIVPSTTPTNCYDSAPYVGFAHATTIIRSYNAIATGHKPTREFERNLAVAIESAYASGIGTMQFWSWYYVDIATGEPIPTNKRRAQNIAVAWWPKGAQKPQFTYASGHKIHVGRGKTHVRLASGLYVMTGDGAIATM